MKLLAWTALSTLALIGLWTLLSEVRGLRSRWALPPGRGPAISVLLIVRDAADVLEGIVRPLLQPESAGWRPRFLYEVVAVDLGSRDESLAILQRLARRDPALRVVAARHGAAVPAPPEPGTPPEAGAADPEVAVLAAAHRLCRHPVVVVCDLRAARARHVYGALTALFAGVAQPVDRRDTRQRARMVEYGT